MSEAGRTGSGPMTHLDDALLQSVFTDPGHADVNQQSTVTHLSPDHQTSLRKIFRVVGGDIENAPEQLGDIERSVASPADNTAPLPV